MVTTRTERKFYEKNGVLFFYLNKPSTADRNCAPTEFDGPATARHMVEYKNDLNKFLEEKAEKERVAAEAAAPKPVEQPEEKKKSLFSW